MLKGIKKREGNTERTIIGKTLRSLKQMPEIIEKSKRNKDYNSKQLQYFELVKTGKIKSPVAKTLDYYQITRDENNEWIMNVLPK